MHDTTHSKLFSQHQLAAQILGKIVWQLFPNVTLVGGGVNSLGFYYDFLLEHPLTEDTMELIDVELYRFIRDGHPVRSISMMKENAQVLLEHHQQFLLAQRAGEDPHNILELVEIGNFYGICPTYSYTSTLDAGYAKLIDHQFFTQKIDDEDVCVTRIMGVTRESAKEAKAFLKTYHQFLKKKDHRQLGPKLHLFTFSEKMGFLGVTWQSKGIKLRQILKDWLSTYLSLEEEEIDTPLLIPKKLAGPDPQTLKSFSFEGVEYLFRTTPLLQHLEFLREKEDLPRQTVSLKEYAHIYVHFPEEQRWGLLCACDQLIDYTTIKTSRDQVVIQMISSLHFIEQIITIFGFEAQWYLIVSRQKNVQFRLERESVDWLKQAIRSYPFKYSLSSEILEEEGSDPRLELRVKDALGREWPTSTLRVIHQLPSQKGESLSKDCTKDRETVVWTRQIWGSLDRFIALLIEKHEGCLPLWLAPEQVRVIVIGEANQAYADCVIQTLQQKGLRVGFDVGQSKLNNKIHEAEKVNVPYIVLIGEQERVKQRLSIRKSGAYSQSQMIDIETLLNKLYQESLPPIPRVEKACYKEKVNQLES